MSYIIATGYGRSVNDDQYTVRIISTLSGSDSTKEFSLDTNGFALIYESVDDQLLVPGIVHSRVEIGTIWSPDAFGTLDTLISLLALSEDGEYIIEIERDSTVIWVGSILNEQFEYTEDSAQREVRIVATDALSLLKDIDYSDDGARYTGRQTLDVVIKNIADKWPLHTYLNGKNLGAAKRFFWADDVYSTDDAFYKLLPHPAGTTYGQIRRAAVHTNCWSSTNNAGQLEFVSCYDVLQSICLSFQWRLYSYEQAWHFVPSNLSAESVNGYIDTWNASTSSGQLVSEFTFQTTGANNIKQKAAGWTKVFSPQLNRVSIKRDTNDGATVLSGYNLSDLDVVTDGDVIYDGQDTENDSVRYLVRGRVNITNTAVGSDLLACEMDGRLVSINLKDKKVTPLAPQYKGQRFNAPNDLVIDRTGGIYFTDPHFRAPEPLPQGKVAVYYRAADGEVTRLVDDLAAPNGVILSPDEKTLYVIPSMSKEMWAYPVTSPGKIGKGRVFCSVKQEPGTPEPGRGGDGLTIDTNGNLYITSGLGLQVFSPEGKLLGIIEVPEKPANVTFGGKDNASLFITARTSLYRVDTKAKGHRFPGKSS